MNQDPFLNEEDRAEDVGMFQAAVHAQPIDLSFRKIERILLALDGSNQDASARALAEAVAAATGATLQETRPTGGTAEILENLRNLSADLLVLPVPFGRDYQILREKSLGSVVDMLLLEAPCPVLCVRDTLDAPAAGAALADLLVAVHVPSAEAVAAVNWAGSILKKGGNLELLAVMDSEALEEARRLLGSTSAARALSADSLVRAVTDDIGSLTAALQKQGMDGGFGVQVGVKEGRAAEIILGESARRTRLMVVPTPKRHTSPAFHRTVDLLLGSRGPVLVVGY